MGNFISRRNTTCLVEDGYCTSSANQELNQMMDHLLKAALNLTVVSLTGFVAAGSVALGYWGALQSLQGKVAGPIDIGMGVGMGVGAWLMAKNRNDLADCHR